MDQEANKRKGSSEMTKEAPDNKIRRTTSRESGSLNFAMLNSQLVEKITAIWKSTSSSAKNSQAYEGQDINVVIKEAEEKYIHATKVVHSIQKKLLSSENHVTELSIALQKETAENQCLKEKSVAALELSESFTQHVSYINDTLSRCKDHAKILEGMYNDVIVKLRDDKKLLSKRIDELNQAILEEEYKESLEQKDLELSEFKIKYKAIDDELSQQKEETRKVIESLKISTETISRMKIVEDKLETTIRELENSLIEEEKKKIDQINFIEGNKIKEIREYYEKELSLAREELNDTKVQIKSINEQKEEILKNYEEKEKLVDSLEKKVEEYSTQLGHLKAELHRVNLALQRSEEEKVNLEKKLNEKQNDSLMTSDKLDLITREKRNLENEIKMLNNKLIKEEAEIKEEKMNFEKKLNEKQQDNLLISDKLDSMTREKSNLADELKILNGKLAKANEEKKEILQELEKKKLQLKEAIQLSENIDADYQHYQKRKESKMTELQKEMEDLKKKMEKVLIENKEVKADKKKLEREYKKESTAQAGKYAECLANLNQVLSSKDDASEEMAASKNALSTLETDHEKLKQKHAKDKREIETKLKKTEELLAEKNDSEKQLKEEISKLEANLEEVNKKCQELEANNLRGTEFKKSLSNIEPEVRTLEKPAITSSQTRKQPTKGGKNIRITEDKILGNKKIKPILKPHPSPKPPKSPGRKLKFNVPSSDSDDNLGLTEDYPPASALSSSEKFDKLFEKLTSASNVQSPGSQGSHSMPASPGTPTQRKFFKNRSIS
ncbi:synaptonemal complex protein 1-like isoform X2 [Microplitis mediator]|uniref:synaptonemal complex protein 1-like isoform X2 n=1 Tax=Microplitis mediator TaxID=375433 RepID=UPI00255319E0|nr:synaptonemal complex protein 1-like isoform X2 [Microplitis mediator]